MTKMNVLYYGPQGRFKGCFQTDVIPWEFINLYKKGTVKNMFSKCFPISPHIQYECKQCLSQKVFYTVWSSDSAYNI